MLRSKPIVRSWSAISGSLPARRPQSRRRFTLERLEGRSLLSTVHPTVNTLADDPGGSVAGQTTLRDAITAADAGSTANKYVSLPSLMFTTLDVPGSTRTTARGINASGQIVGDYFDAGGKDHGFLLRRGSYTTLDPPGSIETEAEGINASGQIVGAYETAGGKQYGFLLSGGSYTTLDVPGSVDTVASGINASGQIVGFYLMLAANTASC